jgi:uncharacterized protein YjbI with pentapeptide repeats
VRTTGLTALLGPLVLLLTAEVSVAGTADPRCPFAGQRPLLEEILKLPREERPPLCRADFFKADLSRANLRGANLRGAILAQANLRGANLDDADLRGADFRLADLGGARLIEANLVEANLRGANLSRAILGQANLRGADLRGANLSGALLHQADLSEAILVQANLSGAYIRWTTLSGANLMVADLGGVRLHEANLSGANLSRANLRGAELVGANLSQANLVDADLSFTMFEPQYQSLGSVVGVESARHMELSRYESSPAALVVLRARFAKAGFRDQERRVTFAKLRSQQLIEWKEGSLWQRIEAGFSYLAFDLPCRYGLDYGRPLRILGALILAFAIVYAFALRSRGRGAIWRVWLPDRIQKDEGQAEPERLSLQGLESPRGSFSQLARAVGLGLLFSLVSAFQIGWRELNVGNWITRLQPREYTLRATGWVRVVSGVQSLLSVYLLALWVLTYFGRPFQ